MTDVVALAESLIAQPSLTGAEGPAVELAAAGSTTRGWSVTPPGALPGSREHLGSRTARAPSPFPRIWIPFRRSSPRREGTRLTGRGACDAKGIAAAMMAAAAALAEAGREAGVDLLFVVGEEKSSDGARAANGSRPPVAFSSTASPRRAGSPRARRAPCASPCAPTDAPRTPRIRSSASRPSTPMLALLSTLEDLELPIDPVLGRDDDQHRHAARRARGEHRSRLRRVAQLMVRLVGDVAASRDILERWSHGRAELEFAPHIPAQHFHTIAGLRGRAGRVHERHSAARAAGARRCCSGLDPSTSRTRRTSSSRSPTCTAPSTATCASCVHYSPHEKDHAPRSRIPVAVLGATGAVGQTFIRLLADHPWFEVAAVAASERSAGKRYRDAAHWLSGEMPRASRMLTVHDVRSVAGRRARSSSRRSTPTAAGEVEAAFARDGTTGAQQRAQLSHGRRRAAAHPRGESGSPGAADVQRKRARLERRDRDELQLLRRWSSRSRWRRCIEAFGVEQLFVTTLQALSGAGYPGVPRSTSSATSSRSSAAARKRRSRRSRSRFSARSSTGA